MKRRDVTDHATLQAWHAIESASYDHDFQALPCDPIEEYVPYIEGHQASDEHVAMYIGEDDLGEPVVTATLVSFTQDNLTAANLEVNVRPDRRREGYGRQMLLQGIDLIRETGRTRIFMSAPGAIAGGDGPAYPLLREVGAEQVLEEVRRLLDLRAHPPAAPGLVPEGYHLRQWVDIAPDDVLEGLAYLRHRMVLDAPMGEMDYEPEVWDAQRYRDSEQSARRRHRTRLSTVAIHEESGEVAGMTEIGINDAPGHQVAHQWNTIVDPRHRGHGLGLLLKASNHQLLAERLPAVRWVNTWNAESNSFMIDVNERLGFRPAERWTQWQLDL